MITLIRMLLVAVATTVLVSACSDGSSGNQRNQAQGFLSVSITDGPWHQGSSVMLRFTYLELRHFNGNTVRLEFPGGPVNVDMMQLQNGASFQFMNRMQVPAGQYDRMRLGLDMSQSYLDDAQTGGRHGMHMGQNSGDWLEVHDPIAIMQGMHHQFMLDYDLRLGIHHEHMGMMGDRFELHQAMRCIDMSNSGGLFGIVDPSLVNVNHPDCDAQADGNWAYLFPGDATQPDDIADVDDDGFGGPIATDKVDMNPATGDYLYHFGYLSEGSYRVGFTCSGEWDEPGDDDYPNDPDALFDFQAFSVPADVVAGEMTDLPLGP